MKSRIKHSYTLIITLLIFFSGCSEPGKQGSGTTKIEKPAPQQLLLQKRKAAQVTLSNPTILRDRLPPNAVAYVRIPDMLDFLSSPKGDLLTEAQANTAHQKIVREIRTAIKTQLGSDTELNLGALQKIFLQYMRSPLELAVLAEEQQPIPIAIAAMKLDINKTQVFADLVKEWIKERQGFYLFNNEVTTDGYASLAKGPVSYQLHFDQESGVMSLMTGVGVDRERFKKVFSGLRNQEHHPMYDLEQQIDSSHHGLFAWVNTQKLLPLLGNTMPPEKYQELTEKGVTDIRAMAFGWGVSDGKGRIKLIVNLPSQSKLRRFIPAAQNDISFQSAGIPKSVVLFAIPSEAQFSAIESGLREIQGEEAEQRYQQGKEKMRERFGIGIEDILAAIGPEVLLVSDEEGDYAAIHVRDRKRYMDFLQRWVKKNDLSYTHTDIRGVTLHHIKLPSLMKITAEERQKQKKVSPIEPYLQRISSHLYWIEEGDYLLMSAVPQMLFEVHAQPRRVSIQQWLTDIQGQDSKHSWMLFSTGVRESPRRVYYGYLEVLNMLADLVGIDIDISKLPSAQDLQLPPSGSYGIQWFASPERVGLEIVFENNPLEFLAAQDMSSVMVIGILAAIAIPAYQDYTLRAQVSSTLAHAEPAKRWVEAFWLENKRFPNSADIAKFDFNRLRGGNISRVVMLPDTGAIVITMGGNAKFKGKRILLKPAATQDGLQWSCKSELADKYMPMSCRG